MNETNLMTDGLFLMLIGMSTVFTFLSLLVLLTSFIKHFAGTESATSSRIRTTQANSQSEEELAAVSAAVFAYRNKNSRS
jgi:oxaloacetate decarboxylase (Na+ extruding) subunit gamma